MPKAKVAGDSSVRRRAPAFSPEDREQQLMAMAIDLAEKQIIEGTASSQVLTHFLKLATIKAQLENEKLHRENELLRAKVDSIRSAENVEMLYKEALDAMRSYGGNSDDRV